MTLTETERQILQDSLARLTEKMNLHPAVFYEALFARAPDLRGMFREDLEGQGMQFMKTLSVIVSKLRDPDALDAQVAELGATHKILGVTREMFAPMEEALIDTMRAALGEDFTPDLEELWRRAYGRISAAMIRQGKIGES
ncbi:MAG: globin domain-containing protein [Marinibacterium sp.]